MKKSTKIMSMLAAAAMLCMSVTGCQNTAENEQVIAYNNAAISSLRSPMMDETGGFYWSDSWRYQYIDPKTNTAAPVCGKPDCKHEEDPDAGCTAVRLVWNSLNSMYYYKEHLYYVYHLPSKKIIKEWTKPYGTEEKLIINPDQTFLMMEKQEDGTYRCTEYNQSCEETVSFVMEEDVSLEKYQDSYYYEKYELIDDTMKKIGDLTQYNIKTGKTTAFPMKESMGMNAIIGDVMLVSGSPDGSPMRGLVDMSCFDTGELEIRPIQGMI